MKPKNRNHNRLRRIYRIVLPCVLVSPDFVINLLVFNTYVKFTVSRIAGLYSLYNEGRIQLQSTTHSNREKIISVTLGYIVFHVSMHGTRVCVWSPVSSTGASLKL